MIEIKAIAHVSIAVGAGVLISLVWIQAIDLYNEYLAGKSAKD